MSPLEARARLEAALFLGDAYDPDLQQDDYWAGYQAGMAERLGLTDAEYRGRSDALHGQRVSDPNVWTAWHEGHLSGLQYGDEPIVEEAALWLI